MSSKEDNSLNSKSDEKNQKKLEHTFKILIIGDSFVGKSCILSRYAEGKFEEDFILTIGVDFKIKDIIVNNKLVKLSIVSKNF